MQLCTAIFVGVKETFFIFHHTILSVKAPSAGKYTPVAAGQRDWTLFCFLHLK